MVQSSLEDNLPEERKGLFRNANRRGLAEPTELAYAITALSVQCYTLIVQNKSIMKKLLTCTSPRSVFIGGKK